LRQAKKCGVGNGDPNPRSQPRLPGSVVGEPSMRQGQGSGQDYEGHRPLVTENGPQRDSPARGSLGGVAFLNNHLGSNGFCVRVDDLERLAVARIDKFDAHVSGPRYFARLERAVRGQAPRTNCREVSPGRRQPRRTHVSSADTFSGESCCRFLPGNDSAMWFEPICYSSRRAEWSMASQLETPAEKLSSAKKGTS
jgi:hypothetical protein